MLTSLAFRPIGTQGGGSIVLLLVLLLAIHLYGYNGLCPVVRYAFSTFHAAFNGAVYEQRRIDPFMDREYCYLLLVKEKVREERRSSGNGLVVSGY